MASLADNIRNNQKVMTRGPGGQLVEETQESIQDLSKKAGLPAPPITAAGASAIGANLDQTKMQGTPAQKTAALNLSAQAAPDQKLSDAQRRQKVRTQATDQESQRIEKSENLQNLGGLGDRVNNLINVQKNNLQNQQAQSRVANSLTGASGQLTSDQAAIAKPLLEQLAADPTNMQLQLEVNKALGYDSTRQLSPAEINNLYASANQSISAAGAAGLQNNVTALDLINQGDLGYDQNQLAELLGVPAEQVGAMSVQQIQDQINKVMTDEFSGTNQLDQQAQSGQLGSAERGAARQAAREASAVGTRSSEADFQSLEKQIQNADQVQFNGQVMSVEQMLSDDNISSTITDYLNAAPDSPQRIQLEKTEPALVDFIKKNELILGDAAKSLSQGADQFQTLQSTNKQTATMGGLLSDNLVSQLIPGFNELSAQNLDPNSIPVLAVAQNLSGPDKQAYAQNLGQVTAQFPEAVNELKDLDPNELTQLDLANPNGRWNQYVDQQRRYQDIMNTPDDDINALLGKIYDTGPNQDYDAALKQNAAQSVLGLSKPNKSLDMIDSDHDGKPDSPAAIKARMVSGTPSLRDAISGKSVVQDQIAFQNNEPIRNVDTKVRQEQSVAGNKDAIRSSLASRLSEVASDGIIDSNDLSTAYSRSYKTLADTSLKEQQQELSFLLKNASLDPQAKQTVAELQKRNIQNITGKLLNGYNERSTDFWSDKLDKAVNPAEKKTLMNSLSAQIKELEASAKQSMFYNQEDVSGRVSELESLRDSIQNSLSKNVKPNPTTKGFNTGTNDRGQTPQAKKSNIANMYLSGAGAGVTDLRNAGFSDAEIAELNKQKANKSGR